MKVHEDELSFRPVTIQEWDDLQALFAEPGMQHGCWCMYWRVRRTDFHRQYGEANRQAMERIIAAGRVPGILAYQGERPIGWCAVAPREDFPVLDRSPTLKRVDGQPVWSIVCFFVSRPHRRQGVSTALIEAAIEYARENGAQIVEAYPVIPENVREPRYERYTGLTSTFEKLGFKEAARRSERRTIMRYYIPDPS